jgi:hypothetical protein
MSTQTMTLENAEKIVHEFAAVVVQESDHEGPASLATRLPHPAARILQAMKLWLAHDIQNQTITDGLISDIKGAAARLPFFIEDGQARRLNAARLNFSAANRAGITAKEFDDRLKAAREVSDWSFRADMVALSLRTELSDFIALVRQFDPNDNLFWQRVYTSAGLEYCPPKRNSDPHPPY